MLMKKIGLLFGAGTLFLALLYLVHFLLPYEFYDILKVVTLILTLLILVFSGTLVSGDRMRANQAIDQTSTNRNMANAGNILAFSLPVYMVIAVMYVF